MLSTGSGYLPVRQGGAARSTAARREFKAYPIFLNAHQTLKKSFGSLTYKEYKSQSQTKSDVLSQGV